MATRMHDLTTRPEDGRPAPRSNMMQAMESVRRLANARSAAVVAFDPHTHMLDPVIASPPGRPAATAPAILDIAAADQGFMFSQTTLRWMSGTGADATVLMMRLGERGAKTIFILFGFDDASATMRARIAKLAPDLVTLIRFYMDAATRVEQMEEIGNAARVVLDHGECGIVAVREDRSVIFSNDAAAAYLGLGFGLQVRRGIIRAVERADATRFNAALDQAMGAPADPRKPPDASVMLLTQTNSKARPTMIVIAPIAPIAASTSASAAAADRAATGRSPAHPAGAVVYILDPTPGALRGLDALCHLHGLSGVESRLLIQLIGGSTLAEAATGMRIKIETARTYLKQIFAKTGTHRQTDLIAVMLRYLRATRGNFDFQPI